MRWQNKRRSQNVEDRRRGGGRRIGKKTGIMGLIIAGIMAFVMGDPAVFFSALTNQSSQPTTQQTPSRQEDQAAEFTRVMLASLEDTWGKVFRQAGFQFQQPNLVLYSGQVQSACGFNTAASGPFYCPGDQKIYLDLSFLNELKRLGAPGDFAFAYVIAHEYGHHISNIIGTLPKVHKAQRRLSKSDANQLSIMLELQADCFAGIWANHAQGMLEAGDIQEGIQAAASVGDDALIGNRPDMFTHGTSAQRMQWLKTGMRSGKVNVCDTFRSYGVNM